MTQLTGPSTSSDALSSMWFRVSPLLWLVLLVLNSGATCAGASANDIERSRREFELAATLHTEGHRPAAIERLRQALEYDEENARAHFLLGYLHMERLDYAEAEPYLQRAIQLMQEQDERGASLAEARNVLGLCLIHLERYEEAASVLRESASDLLNTAPHLAWGNLGLAYLEQNRYDEALEALQEAVRRQGRFCQGYYLMGRTYFEMQDFQRAEEALSFALNADEECESYQRAFRLRGEARARLSLRDEAILDFQRCIELGPNTESGQACQRYLEASQ